MSCCRRPEPMVRHRTRIVAICTNCRGSLRRLLAAALQDLSAKDRRRGVHYATVELTCPACRNVNRLPVSWAKR